MAAPDSPPLNRPARLGEWVTRHLPAVLAFGYFAALAIPPAITSRWLDFPVYWEAGKKALLGQTVYDVVGHFQYKYSPFIALLFGRFFEGIDLADAAFVFQKAMLVLWAALFVRFAKRDFRVVLVAVVFFGNALRLDLELGQINALVLTLLAMLFTSFDRPRSLKEDVPFGLIFAFAVQLKLFSLVLVPLLILRREWRKAALGLLFLPVFSIGGVALVHGWEFALSENRAWIASLTGSTEGLLVSEQNVGALGFFMKSFGFEVGRILWLLLGAGFAFFLWRNRDRTSEWFRDWLLYAVAVFNPLVWSYWILFALPLFASRQRDFEGAFRRRSVATRIGGLAAAIFVFSAFNGQHARWAWSGGIFLGLVVLGIAASRVRAGPKRV